MHLKNYFLLICYLVLWQLNIIAQVCTTTNYTGWTKNNYKMGLQNLYINNQHLFDSASYNNNSVYTNAFDSIKVNVKASQTNTFKITIKNYPQTVKMWVDINKNDTFEKSEVVYYINSIQPGTHTFNYTPMFCNDSFRVRLFVDYAQNYLQTNGDLIDPCKVYYGDVLDFKMIVKPTTGIDLGLDKIISSHKLKQGNNPLKISIKNYGNTYIDSARLYYQVNNGNIYSDTKQGLQLTSCSEYTHTFNDSFNASSGYYKIKTWVKYPNGVNPDSNILNDTNTQIACVPLNGIYSINGQLPTTSTNFKTFNEAFSILNSCGITGPVTFNIAPGIYKDSITLNNINGSSVTNTITFNGIDTNSRILMTSYSDIIHLNESKYIIFKKLTFRVGGNIYNGIVMDGNCEHILIDSCNFTTSSGSQTGISCLTTLNSIGVNNTNNSIISNCTFYNFAGYGIFLGGSYMLSATGNKVCNNYFKNCLTGYRGHYQDTLQVYKNTFQDCNTQGASFFVGNHIKYFQNTINGKGAGVSFVGTADVEIYNNLVSCEANNTTCIQVYKTTNSKIYHNSTYNIGNYSTNFSISFSSAIDIRNNIMSNAGGNTSYLLNAPTDTQFIKLDYNQYYKAGNSSKYVFISGDISNFNILQGRFGFNKNSRDLNPNFVKTTSPRNLHLTNTQPPMYGDTTLGIYIDIDDEVRCKISPTVGADESKYLQTKPISDFNFPDTGYINSPINFINKGSYAQGKKFSWFIDNLSNPISSNTDIKYTFNSLGQHAIKLQTYNCLYTHDTIKNILIVNAISSPISNFTADTTIIDSSENIKLTDLSTNGPVTWQWEITGGNNQGQGADYIYINGSDSTSQNPEIRFYSIGEYTICLKTTNAIGTNTICKSKYIHVYSQLKMCINTYTSEKNGHFYDQGGKNNFYPGSNNTNCSVLISPCAGTVSILFNKIEFDTNYESIKIYDGHNITGKLLNNTQIKTNTIYAATSGEMYIEWSSPFGSNPGWEATWTTLNKFIPKIPATIKANDTAFKNSTHNFEAIYYKNGMTYSWDFDNDGTIDKTGRNVDYIYNNTGTYTAVCYAQSCSGIDTAFKTIYVVAPANMPMPVSMVVDVTAGNACQLKQLNIYNIEVNQTIQLIDKSGNGPTSWKWEIVNSQGLYNWDNGDTIQNPMITFYDTGYYSIQLKVSNSAGSSSQVFTKIIYVHDNYCIPNLTTTSNDYGISKVVFNDIINFSKPNSIYTSYTNVYSTCVEVSKKYGITITRPGNVNNCKIGVWIDYNQDGIFSNAERLSPPTL